MKLQSRRINQRGLGIAIVIILILIGFIGGVLGGIGYGGWHVSQCRQRCKELKDQGGYAECEGQQVCIALREAQCEANCNFY
jgi:hypothetical protein